MRHQSITRSRVLRIPLARSLDRRDPDVTNHDDMGWPIVIANDEQTVVGKRSSAPRINNPGDYRVHHLPLQIRTRTIHVNTWRPLARCRSASDSTRSSFWRPVGPLPAFCDPLFAKRTASNERTSERTKDGLGGRFGLRPLARRARTLEREFIVRRVVRPLVFVFRERRLGKPPPCCDGLVSLSLISSRETAGAAALYDYGSAFLCPECPEV